MTTEHTPGRIRVDQENILRDEAGRTIALLPVSRNLRPPEEVAANARHIEACWNACDGINPEAVPKLLAALEDAHRLIASVRGTLATHVYECGKPGTWAAALDDHMARTTARAHAVIAKAT